MNQNKINNWITEDLKDDAKNMFGITTIPSGAFYINTDGTLLDGSGIKFGSKSPNRRTLDHREISQIFNDDFESNNDAMIKYISEGNIRWSPEGLGVEIMIEPTQAQYITISRLINEYCKKWDAFNVDFVDQRGNYGDNLYYEPIISTNKIISDIKKHFMLAESYAPFELEKEKDRIRDVIDIMDDVKYGFINQETGEVEDDRDWIHHADLTGIYKTNMDPKKTLKDKLGICKDQSIAIRYLMSKYHPEDEVHLYALTTSVQGHCVPTYKHNNKWFYLENAWNLERGIAGPFDSQEELEDYLQFIYYTNHKEDNNLQSIDEVMVEEIKDDRLLKEDTRSQLVSKSKNVGLYTGDKTRGKNRFERKKWSKVATQVKSYNQIDMNDFYKKDQLDVKIPVTGESDSYVVTVRLNGVVAEIAKNIKNNENRFEYKTVLQALIRVFNGGQVYVNCTCSDFCLGENTRIRLTNGDVHAVKTLCKMVKNSKEPLYLYSRDADGNCVPGKILDIWISGWVDHLLEITFSNNQKIKTTEEHKYMLADGSYLPASQLHMGQEIMSMSLGEEKCTKNKITAIMRVDYDVFQPVYDISIEDHHNFFVEAGAVLHNCYRFSHWSVVNHTGTLDSAHDPGPGKGIANPNDDKGKGCKHILLCLSNQDFLNKVASVIFNYTNYIAEHRVGAFEKIIFPKLYNMSPEVAIEKGILPEDTELGSDVNLIDEINSWAKNRGKFMKGSNINPVYANKLQKEQSKKPETDKNKDEG